MAVDSVCLSTSLCLSVCLFECFRRDKSKRFEDIVLKSDDLEASDDRPTGFKWPKVRVAETMYGRGFRSVSA